jgi:prepilin-type N-terminal cleavage/methylation domain-containing protein
MAIKNPQSGITLIEMLVVVAIIAIVSTVLMFNYSDFSTNVSVRNLSQEVALSVRKAQTYATSVRVIDGAGMTSATFPGYGISFATTSQNGSMFAGPKQFVLFADTSAGPPYPSNSFYDAGSNCGKPGVGDECIETFTINTADKVVRICKNNEDPSNPSMCTTYVKADITFRRPVPDADICLIDKNGVFDCEISYVTIVLQSAKGVERYVQVWNTGQISVK